MKRVLSRLVPGAFAARGFTPALVLLLATAPALLAQDQGTAVAGRVVDGEGRPVADAEVRFSLDPESAVFEMLLPDEGQEAHSTRSDASGRFHIDALQPGAPYDVVVVRKGYATLLTSFSPREVGASPELRLVLRRGKMARGRVLDGDRRPVEGAEIRLERNARAGIFRADTSAKAWADRGLHRAHTGPDGRFEVEDLPEHGFDLEIRAPGFAPFREAGFEVSGLQKEPVELGTFRLQPGATAEVRVTDPRGRPIPGAALWLWESGARTPIAESGPDGRVVFRDLDPQKSIALFVCRPGFLSADLLVKGSSPEAARVVLEPAGRIAGRVVDSEGSPVIGAEVHATLTVDPGTYGGVFKGHCPRGDSATGTTDGQGRFALESLLPGTFGLKVLAEGHPAARLNAEAGPDGPELTIEIQSSGAVLAGRVTDLDGRPISGVEISTSSCNLPVASRSDGTYRLSGVAEGVTQVQFDHPDHDPLRKTLRIESGENRFDARLPRIHRYPVRGRVLDPDGRPLAGVRVQLYGMVATATGADGSFALLLEDGNYNLLSQAETHAPAERTVEVAGGPVDGVDLQLTRGTKLSGRVLGLSPAELAGASVEAMSPTQNLTWRSPVDSTGRYHLQGLGPGGWTLRALTFTRHRFEKIVLAPGEKERELDFLLRESFQVSGRVTDLQGRPIARAMVHLGNPDDGATIPTEADGSFSTTLDEGTYRSKAEARAAGYLEAAGPAFELRGGPVEGIEIRLPKGTTLRGHVSGLDRIAPGVDEAVLDLAFTPGTLTNLWVPNGLIATTSYFTKGAQQFKESRYDLALGLRVDCRVDKSLQTSS